MKYKNKFLEYFQLSLSVMKDCGQTFLLQRSILATSTKSFNKIVSDMLPGESQMFSFENCLDIFVPQLSLTQVIPTSHTLDQTRNYSRLFIFQGSASLQLAEKTVSSISCFRNDKSQCQTLKTALQSGWDLRYPWPTNCMWPAPGSKLHRISSLLCSRRIRAFVWLPVEARVWECVCLCVLNVPRNSETVISWRYRRKKHKAMYV